jgi:glucose-1-phosphate adenylyltransferase
MAADENVAADLVPRTLAMVVTEPGGAALGASPRQHAESAPTFDGSRSSGDLPLSNCIHAGIPRIALLGERTVAWWLQHRPHSPYVRRSAPARVSLLGRYAGTADAVYRNLHLLEECSPAYVLVHVGRDASRRMDYRGLLEAHAMNGVGATVGCLEMPMESARDFGVVGVAPNRRVVRFTDQPARPQSLPDDPTRALVSIGVYVFDSELLVDCLSVDAADRWSGHDISRDVLPLLIRAGGGVAAHVLRDSHAIAGDR